MRYAILTDIHANREALEAVLADMAGRSLDAIAVLGDIVGYGADPEWCCETLIPLVADGAICVRGNHDTAATSAFDGMTTNAKRAIDWTRTRLSPAHAAFLAALPLTARRGEVAFVHASMNAPDAWSYITSDTRALPSFRSTDARLIFCGHVHIPLLASSDPGGTVREIGFRIGSPIPLLSSRRWLAVVGSVGQPRDGSPQAAWAILDTEANELSFRRTPYDTAGAAQKIRAAGLPEALATRILTGR